MQSFAGKTVIVTGASDGIGAEMARQLSREQPNLVLAARREDRLNEVAFQCRKAGAEVIVVPTDVTDREQCRRLVAAAVDRFQGLDLLINNAGLAMQARLDAIADLDAYERLMQVNFFGAVWCTHAALPHLKSSRGRLAAVSSLLGKFGAAERSAYCASKFALGGFFESLRLELYQSGVTVTLVYPGQVATQMHRQALGVDGRTLSADAAAALPEPTGMPIARCAGEAIAAIRERRHERVLNTRARLDLRLKAFLPDTYERIAMKAALRRT